jgi:hypothetical protein
MTNVFRTRRGLPITAIAGFAAATLGVAQPVWAAAGWQTVGTFNVATGTTGQQIGYNCPSQFPVAHNGSYAMNGVGQASQVYLTFNGTRIDQSPASFSEWAWHFYWPAGAPSGITILLDVYCAKK